MLINRNSRENKAIFHGFLVFRGLILILCLDNDLAGGKPVTWLWGPIFGVFREEGERFVAPNFTGQDGCGRPFLCLARSPSYYYNSRINGRKQNTKPEA